jgi:hypothetical protein
MQFAMSDSPDLFRSRDDHELAAVLSRLRGDAVLMLVASPHRIEVRSKGRERYELTLRPERPKFWRNYTLVSRSSLDRARVLDCIVRARANDRAWANAIAWHAPRKPNQGRMIGLIALAVFGIPYAIFGGYALYTNAPGVDAKTFSIGFIAIAVMACYIAWIDFFFGPVREGAARVAGRWLGGKVSESHGLDAGTWNIETPNRASLGRTVYANVLIGAIDLAVLLAGTVLPVAIGAIALFLIFDN